MTILEEIVARRRIDIAARREALPEPILSRFAAGMTRPPSFAAALRATDRGPRVIAEIKRASPSKGLIRKDFPVVDLARQLAAGGAAALSVLTEMHYFQGCLRYLRLASDNVGIPVLRKDFIVDTYQLCEARAFGASAVLLIAAALDDAALKRLKARAEELDLDVLAEVHNEEELERVLAAGCRIVGVNSRNLKTFEVDLDLGARLLEALPDTVIKVAESGIRNAEDIGRMAASGTHAFLIGETLMRAKSPQRALQELMGG